MRTWYLVLGVVLVLTACARPSPTGALEYSTAVDAGIPAGKTLPGTEIQYLGKSDQGAQMSIGGETALKRTFDSLTWRGDPAPGVTVDYSLRIISFDARELRAAGTAKVTIVNAKPKAVASLALPENTLTFKGLVSYDVPKGTQIPGTTISYDGSSPDGARLGGVEGYPFRKAADSIAWTGQLADKLYLEQSLRVLTFDDNALRTTGTATVYITP